MLLQSGKRPADGKAVWQRCEARGCEHCGPPLAEANLAHDIGNLVAAGRPVLARVVKNDPATWKRLVAKIKRASSGWVAYPQPDGSLLVYANAGMTGALVGDVAGHLGRAYGRIPEGARIRRPRAWALHKGAPKAEAKSWKLLGSSAVTDRVPDVLQRLGLYRGEADEAAVPLNAWEVHNFEVPALESLAFRQLEQALGLERGCARPGRRRRPAA
jgi:hypothetical protein